MHLIPKHASKVILFPQMPKVAAATLARRILVAEATNQAADNATFTDVRKFLPGIRAANEGQL